METFDDIKDQLRLTQDNRLMLNRVPMIITPVWFFAGIVKRLTEKAGVKLASDVLYEAGYQGAYDWAVVQMQDGLDGRAVMEQYLASMTNRGWGRFEIVSFARNRGKGRFRFFNSAIALDHGCTGNRVCHCFSGALAGGFQAILNSDGAGLKVNGRETACYSEGGDLCEFEVGPAV